MNSKQELLETALHILVGWINGRKPSSADLELLKSAFPSLAHLPADELACQVIHDLNSVVISEQDESHGQKETADRVA